MRFRAMEAGETLLELGISATKIDSLNVLVAEFLNIGQEQNNSGDNWLQELLLTERALLFVFINIPGPTNLQTAIHERPSSSAVTAANSRPLLFSASETQPSAKEFE